MERDRAVPRRHVLKLGGTSLALFGLGRALPLAEALAPPSPASRGVLVVFFQRGAADGLHAVPPYRDGSYRRLRGTLALPEPGGRDDATLDLGDGFALHPALRPLHALYGQGSLAVVHAVGSPDATRSHFDAQDYMESGTPGNKGTRDGWLNRALAAMPAQGGRPSPFRAIALTPTLPRALAGSQDAIALQDWSRMAPPSGAAPLAERIEKMYASDDDPEFRKAGAEAFEAVQLFRAKDPLGKPVRAGVTYPRNRSAQAFSQLAAILKSDLGVRVAFLEGSGWDNHFNQGGVNGQMANVLRELSGNTAAFLKDVGDVVPVTFLTMTEFGRTAAANGSGGTDHGHGTAMIAAGRGVRGGKVHGSWPGLSSMELYEGRDLAVTTDFRDLFAEVAAAALSLPPDVALFPDHRRQRVGVMA